MKRVLPLRRAIIYSEALNAWRAYVFTDKRRKYIGCYNTKLGAEFAKWIYEEYHDIQHEAEFPLRRRKNVHTCKSS